MPTSVKEQKKCWQSLKFGEIDYVISQNRFLLAVSFVWAGELMNISDVL